MRYANSRRVQLFTAATILTLAGSILPAAPASAGVTATSHFVIFQDQTISGDSAFIDNGATNGRPHDLLFVAVNFTPGGVCGCVLLKKIVGVWYDSLMHQWAVFNEDVTTMPTAPSFNILVVPKASKSAFVQTATGANTHGNHTFINSRLLNGKPGATIQITQNFNPGGTAAGTNNSHPVGVRYYPSKKRWAIVNLDGAAIPLGAAFNVLIGSGPSNGGKAVVVTDTSNKVSPGSVVFKNSASNGNPNTVVFVTPNVNPNGKGGTADPHPLWVGYETAFSEAAIINADFTIPPLHSAFNVLVFSS